ncbi:hypothetical protein MNB_SV-13-1304 [hydrothermal vent metagenome]|uniref:Uncharacterized protein n=1 Tax=hydrothermal vent metagenome TaxID=652676 RepID=A0A1W1CE36_9ZZZZ
MHPLCSLVNTAMFKLAPKGRFRDLLNATSAWTNPCLAREFGL